MIITVEGIDGQPGSKYIWKGDSRKTGEGEMMNTGIKVNEEILYHLHFIAPWDSESDGWVRISDAASGVQASGTTMLGAPVGLFFSRDEEKGVTDLAAGHQCAAAFRPITLP